MRFFSPAKINLFLQVVSKRPDGFHDLATAMQAISFWDELEFSESRSDRLTCNNPSIPTGSDNLILKAAELFRKKSGINLYICCHLEKRIPAQAGLGGGSGNAATTLWAMNQMAGKPATNEQLMSWSAEIGSDLPFFFSTGSAYCTGRGECVKSLDVPLLKGAISIKKPRLGVCTAACFGALKMDDLRDKDPEATLSDLIKGVPAFYNDLEAPAFRLHSQLADFKQQIASFAPQMTGTGSAFWCRQPASSEQQFKAVMRQLDSWYYPGL